MTTGISIGRARHSVRAALRIQTTGAPGVTCATSPAFLAKDSPGLGWFLKFLCVIGILVLELTLCGCESKSSADARVQAAYFAGQKAALMATGADPRTSVGVVGPVKHSRVPWVDGLTLVQAVATAEYVGRHNPQQIIITRHGQLINIDPNAVLNGHPVPLQPGDTVELREEKIMPKPEPRPSTQPGI